MSEDTPEPPVQPMVPAASALTSEVTAPSTRRHQAAIGFIFATALMDMMAIGIVIPVLPQLVKHFTHGDTAQAATYVGLYTAVWALMQFIFSPVQGALSDHFGRRPVLLASVFGLSADYVLMALAPDVWWLFVGRTISGITAASFSTANAYIADITPPEQRAGRFGLMGAAFGIGFIIGPTLGGLLGQIDPRLPFWAAAALAFINGLYGLFILPESLPKSRRAPFRLANASPLGSLKLLTHHRGLVQLGMVMFLYFLGFQVLPSVSVLYTGFRYGWSTGTIGLLMGGVGLGNIVVQAGIVKPFVRRFKERGALYTGLLFAAAGMFVYGAAPNGAIYWLGLPLYAMVGLVQPGVQGMMTRRIGPMEQGRLQGANASIMAAAGLIGPLLFTQILRKIVPGGPHSWFAGAPFYLASLMFFLSLIMALATRPQGEPVAKT